VVKSNFRIDSLTSKFALPFIFRIFLSRRYAPHKVMEPDCTAQQEVS
jgi:hypothetical protein